MTAPASGKRPKRWQGVLRVVKVAGTCGLLAVVFARIDASHLLDTLAGTRVSLILCGLGLSAVSRWLGAYQMKRVMDTVGIALTMWQVLLVNLSAAFYELVLPGAHVSGGLVRLHKFSRGKQENAQQALAAMLFNRFMDTLTLVALGLGFWMFSRPDGSWGAIGAALVALLAALLVFHLEVKHGWLSAIVAPWPALRACWRAVPEGLRGAAERMAGDLVRSYRRFRLAHAAMAPIGLMSAARHLLFIAALTCFARSIGISAPWMVFGWLRTVVVLLMFLPISIAGFGLREGSLVVLLAPFGVSASQAVALSLIMFASGAVFGLLGGFSELAQALDAGKPRHAKAAAS